MTENAWLTKPEKEALAFIVKTRRQFTGLFGPLERATAADREMLPVKIDVAIAVLRDIVAAFPNRAAQVERLITQLDIVKLKGTRFWR